jgi:hypothetical protein
VLIPALHQSLSNPQALSFLLILTKLIDFSHNVLEPKVHIKGRYIRVPGPCCTEADKSSLVQRRTFSAQKGCLTNLKQAWLMADTTASIRISGPRSVIFGSGSATNAEIGNMWYSTNNKICQVEISRERRYPTLKHPGVSSKPPRYFEMSMAFRKETG